MTIQEYLEANAKQYSFVVRMDNESKVWHEDRPVRSVDSHVQELLDIHGRSIKGFDRALAALNLLDDGSENQYYGFNETAFLCWKEARSKQHGWGNLGL